MGNLLGLIGWDGRRVDAVANTGDASSDNELGSSTVGGRNRGDLDNDTDDHDHGTEEDALAATKLVTKDEDEASTEEATASVDGDDEALVGRVAVDLGESLDESRGRDDTAHDTLVVAEEQEVGDGDDGDEELKHPSGLAPVGGYAICALFDTWRHGCSVSMDGGEGDEEMLGRRQAGEREKVRPYK